jgi:hypothetical protein
MTEHKHHECEDYAPPRDLLLTASWPLVEYILNATSERSQARTEAVNKLMQAVETIRGILAKSQMH